MPYNSWSTVNENWFGLPIEIHPETSLSDREPKSRAHINCSTAVEWVVGLGVQVGPCRLRGPASIRRRLIGCGRVQTIWHCLSERLDFPVDRCEKLIRFYPEMAQVYTFVRVNVPVKIHYSSVLGENVKGKTSRRSSLFNILRERCSIQIASCLWFCEAP